MENHAKDLRTRASHRLHGNRSTCDIIITILVLFIAFCAFERYGDYYELQIQANAIYERTIRCGRIVLYSVCGFGCAFRNKYVCAFAYLADIGIRNYYICRFPRLFKEYSCTQGGE